MKTFINMTNFNKRLYDRDKYYILIMSFSPKRPNLKIKEDRVYRIYLTGKSVKEFKNSFIGIPISGYLRNEAHVRNKYLDKRVGELWYHLKDRTFRNITYKIWSKMHRLLRFDYNIKSTLHEVDSYRDYDKLMAMISLCR